MRVHISEIDRLCQIVGVSRIPSNYRGHSSSEKEYYDSYENFIVERHDGTPVNTYFSELESAALPDYYG